MTSSQYLLVHSIRGKRRPTSPSCILFFLEFAADRRGGTPLHVAAENGRDGMIALLLDHGASLEAKDDYGQGPRMGSWLRFMMVYVKES